MPSTDRWTQARVGLFVALAGMLLFGAITYVGLAGTPFARRATVRVDLEDLSGLSLGSRVEMGGVKVGEIAQVHLPNLETGRVPLDLAIDPRALDLIGPSSRAFLGSHALVGQRYLGITPRRADDPPIKSGGTVQARETVDTAALVARAGRLMDQLEGVLGDVRSLTRSLTEAGDNNGPLALLLHDEKVAKELREIVTNVLDLSEVATHGDGPLATLVHDEAFARDLRDGARAVAGTTRRVAAGEGVLGRLLHDGDAVARVDRTLANLDTVTTRLVDAKGTLGSLISDPAMLTQLNALVTQLDSLVGDLRRNPQRYIKIQAF